MQTATLQAHRTAPPRGILISIPLAPNQLISEKLRAIADCAEMTEHTLRPISADVNDAITDATLSVVVELLVDSARPGDAALLNEIAAFLAVRGRF